MAQHDLSAVIIKKELEGECIEFTFPEVILRDKSVQAEINEMIGDIVDSLIPDDINTVNGCSVEVTGESRVTVNQDSVLSIRFESFIFPKHAANGSTTVRALNVDLRDGMVYELQDLFKPRSRFRLVINEIIEQEIAARELPLLNGFPGITDNQEFYLTEENLVIFFQELEFTPHYVGPPEFPIPYELLVNMIRPNSPIARLLDEEG